ncbi:MAG: hypothetical protein CL676_06450 [Bdellovibrionaceae bacterium]|nr:hypothetical protein [Pseudobdellovibrionaceae bacterium]
MSIAALGILASIFTASFLGSWHCGLMCGGFSMGFTRGFTGRLISYHMGRWITYSLMGGLVGAFGQSLLQDTGSIRPYIGGVFAFFLLLLLAFNLLHFLTKTASKPQVFEKLRNPRWLQNAIKWAYQKPFASFYLGLLSVFLPCGWLYGFLFAAGASGSFFAGFLTMTAFWAGGLPALILGPLYFKNTFSKISPRWQPALQSVVLITALFSLASFFI